MIDTHCHLDYCEAPERAADAGLDALVSVGTTLERCKRTLQLAEQFGHVWAAVGIHPNDVEEAAEEIVREQIEELACHPKVVAVGETGIDTYWDKHPVSAQRESFFWQADLAKRLDKPLILHVRDKQGQEDASLEAARLITEAGHPKGILHCFKKGCWTLGWGSAGWSRSQATSPTKTPRQSRLQPSAYLLNVYSSRPTAPTSRHRRSAASATCRRMCASLQRF